MVLDRHSILAAKDLTFKDVEVKEWGGTVRIRSLPCRAREEFESKVIEMQKNNDISGLRPLLVSLSLVDENGKLLFESEADLKELSEKSADVIDRLFLECQNFSALTNESVEDLEKN